jgi:hypothetical protein
LVETNSKEGINNIIGLYGYENNLYAQYIYGLIIPHIGLLEHDNDESAEIVFKKNSNNINLYIESDNYSRKIGEFTKKQIYDIISYLKINTVVYDQYGIDI